MSDACFVSLNINFHIRLLLVFLVFLIHLRLKQQQLQDYWNFSTPKTACHAVLFTHVFHFCLNLDIWGEFLGEWRNSYSFCWCPWQLQSNCETKGKKKRRKRRIHEKMNINRTLDYKQMIDSWLLQMNSSSFVFMFWRLFIVHLSSYDDNTYSIYTKNLIRIEWPAKDEYAQGFPSFRMSVRKQSNQSFEQMKEMMILKKWKRKSKERESLIHGLLVTQSPVTSLEKTDVTDWTNRPLKLRQNEYRVSSLLLFLYLIPPLLDHWFCFLSLM